MNNKKRNGLRINKNPSPKGGGRITFVYTKVHPAIKKVYFKQRT